MAGKYLKTQACLNQLIADISTLGVIVHQTHWYMRGPEFFKLHPKMDEFLDDLNDQLDEIAERLIALGGSPYATTQEFIDNTGLTESKGDWDIPLPERMAHLVEAYKYLRDQYQTAIEVTDEDQDLPTQDMINGFKMDTDKVIWMLQAYLGKAPLE
ncbi:Dps family protein [Secundilactobacillus malefermentans]|uniref:Ferritin/DPS domain-containing protein n=1 Tax=Secundilactobacillus malefermentans TaxID=176292 RepID=A0A4V3A473_9LACO|nr:Dps family protein [Secundilactobacillus malefermentans]KRM58983.1 DNA-binding ferritin-like protein [Secundilactobacillus malefermentans DSM 5705 = KCTC 3548]QEA31907.1 DNA starvation/stationary phase protection protein [Secundilactobacillus malefermentans]TDG79472.1 hypothetical protein C5L31_000739 [Secundilactobacillus malefermentans]